MNWNSQIPTPDGDAAAMAGDRRGILSRLGLYALSAAVALALVASIGAGKAQAGHKWIGPAIAGAIVGGIIAHHAYRHHHHHYRHHHSKRYYYYPPRPRVVVRRHYHRPHYHGRTVYVAPGHGYYAPPGYILYGP